MRITIFNIIGQLFLMSLLLMTVACAPKSKKSSSASIVVMGAAFTGGTQYAILYGKGPDQKFAKPIPVSGEIVIPDLKNGLWNFYIVGYSLPNLSGVMKCDSVVEELKGGNIELSLTITNAKCNQQPFVSQNGIGSNWENPLSPGAIEPPQVLLNNCKSLSKITANQASNPDVVSKCVDENIGPYTSFRIGLGFFDSKLDPAGSLDVNFSSVCFRSGVTLGTGMTTTPLAGNPKLPTGLNETAPFYTVVRAYYGSTDCGDTNPSHGFKEFKFMDGVHGLNRTHVYLNSVYYTAINLDAADAEICSIPRLSTTHHHPFAAGNGTGVPYRICNEAQFNSVGGIRWKDATNDFYNKNFALARSLDFRLNSTVSNLGGAPASYANFVPWGLNISTAMSATDGFSGSFFGNNYKINYPFLFLKSNFASINGQYGLFRRLEVAKVYDLTIKNAAIECEGDTTPTNCDNVGVLTGNSIGATSAKNIKVHGFAQGYENVGGVIGYVDSGSLFEYIHANVHLDVNNFGGGIFGKFAGGTLHYSSSNVEINGKKSTSNRIGGIVGSMLNASIISYVSSRGSIRGDSYLGGIVGQQLAGNISHVYSLASVHSSNTSNGQKSGGIVGETTGAVSYVVSTLGKISHNQSGGTPTVGGISGNGCGANFVTSLPLGVACGATQKTASAMELLATYVTIWGVPAPPAPPIIVNASPNLISFFLPFDGDIPRLGYEVLPNPRTGIIVENEVPYLNRKCNSAQHFGNIVKDNTICTTDQFLNRLNQGVQYKLGRSLEFGSNNPTAIEFGNRLKIPGVWKISGAWPDGNEYGLYNITLKPDDTDAAVGIFGSLDDGSNISNLSLSNVKIEKTSGVLVGTNSPKFIGLLAGINNESISKVKLKDGEIKLANIDLDSTDGIVLGSLVGLNTGTISDLEIYSSINLQNLTTSSADVFQAAGAVGVNSTLGTMQRLRLGPQIRYNSTNSTTDTDSNFALAAAAVINDGTISEVGVEHGGIYIENSAVSSASAGSTNGLVSGFVVINNDEIRDSFSKISFQLDGTIASPKDFQGTAAAFAAVNEGSLTRVYYFKEMNGDQNRIDEVGPGTTTAFFALDDSGGTQTGTFCVDYHEKFCGGATLGPANESFNTSASYQFNLVGGDLVINGGAPVTVSDWNTSGVVGGMFFNFPTGTWLIEPNSYRPPELLRIDGGLEKIKPGF
jgi:hypothetical protein